MAARNSHVRGDVEIGARFEPKIIGKALMRNAGRREILLGVRGHGQERVVDVGRVGIALDGGPILVFHSYNEHSLDGLQREGREGGECVINSLIVVDPCAAARSRGNIEIIRRAGLQAGQIDRVRRNAGARGHHIRVGRN